MEIAFELISLFYVQIQEPTSRSTTTRALVFLAKFAEFYYHKIFETGNWWRPKRLRGWTLPLCLLCNWRYKDLSVSHDQKLMTLLTPMEKSPISFYHRVVLLSKFDNSCPSVTWEKDLSRDYELMTSLAPEVEYPMEPFQ